MAAVYKYTKLEYLEETLRYGIFASDVTSFNDPYEYYGIEGIERLRICCLSRSANAKLMWSHYADGHRGCSVQIVLPEDWEQESCTLKKVSYQSRSEDRGRWSIEEAYNGLFMKDKKWSKDLEVRAIYAQGISNEDEWVLRGEKRFFKAKIRAVNFGCMSDESSDAYIKVLELIRAKNQRLSRKERIKVNRYQMDANGGFRFRQIPSYDWEVLLTGRSA